MPTDQRRSSLASSVTYKALQPSLGIHGRCPARSGAEPYRGSTRITLELVSTSKASTTDAPRSGDGFLGLVEHCRKDVQAPDEPKDPIVRASVGTVLGHLTPSIPSAWLLRYDSIGDVALHHGAVKMSLKLSSP